MKKYLILALCLLSFTCLRAQAVFTHSFTSGHIHVSVVDTLRHDSAYCQTFFDYNYTITIDSSYVGDSIRIVDTMTGALMWGCPFVNTSGVSPWSITVPEYMAGWGDMSVTAGGGYSHFQILPQKITTRTDTLRYVQYHDSLWVLPCLYSTASGKVYIDNNTNCTYDAGDGLLNQWIVPNLLEHVASPVGTINQASGGTYGSGSTYTSIIQKSWMVDYTMSLPPEYAFIFPTSPCFSGSYTLTTLPQTAVDFPLLCTSNVDVQCYALSPGRVRLHTPFIMHPYVSNTGCDSTSGTLTLVKDPHVTYDASLSAVPADFVYGDTLIWHYGPLTSLTAGAYWNSFMSGIHLTPDLTLVAGDTLCFRVYTNIPSTDVNSANNDYSICIPVVYSFDPNSKEASPAGTGPTGILPNNTEELTYTINFQNTGSDVAYDVAIIDTLDSDLNATTLKILGTSHNMTPKWLTPNVVEFDFNSIMLPDSASNEPGSHGQVRFSVALKPGLPVGTVIKNTGYIYFDANPPVITNTKTNILSWPSSVQQVAEAKSLKVYPNPAIDELTVENLGDGDIIILSINGSVLMKKHATGSKTVIDISDLPAGVYILKTLNDITAATTRFTKY